MADIAQEIFSQLYNGAQQFGYVGAMYKFLGFYRGKDIFDRALELGEDSPEFEELYSDIRMEMGRHGYNPENLAYGVIDRNDISFNKIRVMESEDSALTEILHKELGHHSLVSDDIFYGLVKYYADIAKLVLKHIFIELLEKEKEKELKFRRR